MSDVTSAFHTKEEVVRSFGSPTLIAGWGLQGIKGSVNLNRIERPTREVQLFALRQSMGIKFASPPAISPAGDTNPDHDWISQLALWTGRWECDPGKAIRRKLLKLVLVSEFGRREVIPAYHASTRQPIAVVLRQWNCYFGARLPFSTITSLRQRLLDVKILIDTYSARAYDEFRL
jgi:hypothetical protein